MVSAESSAGPAPTFKVPAPGRMVTLGHSNSGGLADAWSAPTAFTPLNMLERLDIPGMLEVEDDEQPASAIPIAAIAPAGRASPPRNTRSNTGLLMLNP